MSKGIGWALGVILLIVLCVWVYRNNSANASSKAGVVTPLDAGSSASPSASSSDSATNIDGETSRSAPAPAQPQSTASIPPAATASTMIPPAPAATPASDTLTPASPNGMAFGGKGRFQWYRQGNLTWRIDTISGATCIDFATMEEWSKDIVYTHGCSGS